MLTTVLRTLGRAGLLTLLLALPAPAQNTPAANAPAAAGEKERQIVVKAPAGGEYTASVTPGGGAPQRFTETVALTAPAGEAEVSVRVLHRGSGYAARKTVQPKEQTTTVTFASEDFNLLNRLRVVATGKDGQPVARAGVTLVDPKSKTWNEQIDEGSQGEVEFHDVPRGEASITVTPDGGAATTKDLRVELQPGETTLTVTVAMPEVTEVVASTAAPAEPSTSTSPAGAQPPPVATPPSPRGDFLSRLFVWLVQLLILAAIIFGGYRYAKKQGWTVETIIKSLGVAPDAPSAAGAGSGPAQPISPGPPAPPPPVVADPNRCQFCGELKAADGSCACSVIKGQPAAAVGGGAFVASASREGPRLIGVAGTYMGHIFKLQGEALISREPGSPVPLDQDTSVSRRHATIAPRNGGFVIRDEGSSNGTFVNGARVSESPLSPGDEVSIGGTRFRFEA